MSLSRNAALRRQFLALVFFALFSQLAASSQVLTNGNRLVYLDESDPFHPGLNFPKLATPQWIGEPGVDAAVILAIDDMRDIKHYEEYVRPILERLKKIDGRAHFSIMTIKVKTDDSQLQTWLKEGVSLEVHTLTHPEPLLAKGDFAAAANTYNGCIDMLREIPGNNPVAFRMPYCDSLDTPSPRFYAELFNSTNSSGQFLQIDSSVMNITTGADPILPRAIVFQADGKERFRKYIPFPSFVTTIDNYPYPYVIGRLCWEFPAMVPSDWEAKNIHGTNNPVTVADWKAALDATVLKQGAFTFIFHPHGWIRPDQLVEFIDYAVTKYGKRVKFLSFAEAAERLNANLLGGQPLRAGDGADNGVRLLDLDNDGYLDVVIGNDQMQRTRVWQPKAQSWRDGSLPVKIVSQLPKPRRTGDGVRFGVIGPEHHVAMLASGASEPSTEAFVFEGQSWKKQTDLLRGLEINGQPVSTTRGERDAGVRFRDLDNDGQCELLVGNDTQSAVFNWSDQDQTWKTASFKLPAGVSIVNENGADAGLRFVDINGDGYFDLLFSNDRRFSLQLFRPKADERLFWQAGWTDEVISRNRTDGDLIPRIVRGGAHPNNGVWFHSGTMWVQNEDTAGLSDHVDRRAFQQLLRIDQTQPLTPEKSLASIKVHPRFKVELVASEPLIEDPVAFDWGADGKLWVVEMIDYPLGIDGHGQPGGRVRFLEDTDGDGRYDKSTIFLDGLNFPNGIIPWRKGVIVSSVPEIFYAEDTDGDGKADLRKTLFIGFAEGNQQHRANGFEYGIDNWLYGANGDSGGTVQAIARLVEVGEFPNRGQSVNLRGHDFRIRPDEGLFETVAGQAQFGRHKNDWGDWFGNENPIWLWHYFLSEHYLARNPNLAVRDTKRVLANYPDSTRAFPISRTLQRFNDPAAANHVTSANSATAYRDELFGAAFSNSIFISEPVHNLIHREVLERDGVSFTSRRAVEEQDSEFVASTDNWFRPTMLKTGPDGALYIADMYRQVIEHPEWIPAEMQKRLDLRAGADKGRIYRVYPADATLRPIPHLDKLGATELVNAMDSANGWQRDTAQRLLVHARDSRAVQPLQDLLTSAKRPQTRLQALGALGGIGAVTPELLEQALRDAHPAVRCLALQIAEVPLSQMERGLQSGGSPSVTNSFDLTRAVLKLVNDPQIRVRYQLAFTLGEWRSTEAAHALVALARADGGSPEMMTAVLSSAEPHAPEMLRVLLAERDAAAQPGPLLGALLTSTSVARDSAAVAGAVNVICHLPSSGSFQTWQFRALIGLVDGLERLNEPLDKFVKAAGVKSADVEGIFAGARKLATNPQASEAERIAATGLLARSAGFSRSSNDTEDFTLLGQLLSPSNPPAIQEASLEALKRSRQPRAASVILANWRGFGPAFRLRALNALGSRSEWIKSLLSAMEAGKISPGEIGPGFQQRLLSSHDESIRGRAQKLLGSTRPDRQALVRQYSAALTGSNDSGDASKGAVLFRQNCAVCHRLRGEGNEIGPDLGAVSGKPTEVLLAAILDPNQAVEARYLSYNIALKGGRELTGVISGETSTSITVRNQGGAEEVLLRSDVTELTGSGLSLMPEGLEKVLKPSDIADLIAWLRTK